MSEKTFRVILALVVVIWAIFVLVPSLADFLPRAWATIQLLLPGDRPGIVVTVKEVRTGDPVAGCRVQIVTEQAALSATTDKTGTAVFEAVPAGPAHKITAQKVDYTLAELPIMEIPHRQRARFSLAVEPSEGRRLYVGHESPGSTTGFSVLDVASRLPMTAPGNAWAWEGVPAIAVKASSSDSRLYVLGRDQLTVLSLHDGSVIKQMALQAPAGGLGVSPDGDAVFLFVAGQGGRGRWLTAIYTRTWSERYSLQVSTTAERAVILPSSDGQRVYVAPVGDQSVSVFDARVARRLAVLPLGDTITDAALSDNGRALYMLTERRQIPFLLDTATYTQTTTILDSSARSAVAGATRMIYARFEIGEWLCLLQPGAQQVTLIDINTKGMRSVKVGKDPVALAAIPYHDELYVAGRGGNDLSLISLTKGTLVDSIDVRSKPWLLTVP